MAESLKIGDAGEKGNGVFATRRIFPGELIFDYAGKEEWIWDIPKEVWQYTFQVGYDRYVLPEKGSVGWYLNHSCEPNCVITRKTRIIALRTVEEGEEVTFDYSTNVGWDGFAMECHCGSSSCRHIVRSYRYLDPRLRESYGALVSEFLLKPAG